MSTSEGQYRISEIDPVQLLAAPGAQFIIRTMLTLNHQQTIRYLMTLNENASVKDGGIVQVKGMIEKHLNIIQQSDLFEAVTAVLKTKSSRTEQPGSIEELIQSDPELAAARKELELLRDKSHPWQSLKEVRNQLGFHYNANNDSEAIESTIRIFATSVNEESESPNYQAIDDLKNKHRWYLLASTIETEMWREFFMGRLSAEKKREGLQADFSEDDMQNWFKSLLIAYLKFAKMLINRWLDANSLQCPIEVKSDH